MEVIYSSEASVVTLFSYKSSALISMEEKENKMK
jgi:hypothetical protein